MKFLSGPFLYVIIIVAAIALLLLILWLLGEIRRRKYYDDAVRYMLQPERAPVPLATWGEVSAPDQNGVMTCNATTPLEGLTDQVHLALKSKDKSGIEDFTKNVKFQFSPIYTSPPVDPFQSLLKTLGVQRSPSTGSSKGVPHLDKNIGPSFPDNIILDAHDLLLEFGMQVDRVYEPKTRQSRVQTLDSGHPYYAVGFNIDPTIRRIHALSRCPTPIRCNCNRRDYYSSTETHINATVVGDVGSVRANPGGIVNAGRNSGEIKSSFSVSGRNLNENTYHLTGTFR